MGTILCCTVPTTLDCWNLINLALAIFATIISIGYFIRPRLHYCVYKRKGSHEILTDNSKIKSDSKGNMKSKNQEKSIDNPNFVFRTDIDDPFGEEIIKDNIYENSMNSNELNNPINNPKDKTDKISKDYKWIVKVINKNFICVTVKEIECEVAFSRSLDFNLARTIHLIKEKTLFLKSNKINPANNYLFISKGSGLKYSGYPYLRVRLLATNFLGIKKHYERIYNIPAELSEEKLDCDPQCQCYQLMSSSGIKNCCLSNIRCAIWSCFRRKKARVR